MKPTDEQYELIDQYLQGELSGEELSTIEALIANDPEFAEAVQAERILIAAIQQVAREEMKEKLNKIPLAATKTNPYKPLLWILAAASVLLFSGLGIKFLLEKSNTSQSKKEMAFNLPIKTIGVKNTSLGYIVPDSIINESSTLPIRLQIDDKHTQHYRLTDTLTLQGRFAIADNALELIRLNEKDVSQLYLKIDNRFYPLSKTYELVPLKAEMDERVLLRLAVTQPNDESMALQEPSHTMWEKVNVEFDSTWTKNTKPEPLFTDKQLEEKLNSLNKLSSREKKTVTEEIQKNFNNPMKSQAITGAFTDDKKSSYTINEYTRRMSMTDGLRTKVVKVARNDNGRIISMEVAEFETE